MNPIESGRAVEVTREGVTGSMGRLKNGNPPGNPSKSPRCGARTRAGTSCRSPGMRDRPGAYGRCRMHGGASTGPRTPEGLVRSQRANWRDGKYSQERKQSRRELRAFVRWENAEMQALWREFSAWQRVSRREQATPHSPNTSITILSFHKPTA